MKKMLFLAGVVALLTACNTQQGYVINGTIEGASDGDTIYIVNLNSNQFLPSDTAIIKGGKFTFRGVQEKPIATYIAYKINDPAARNYTSLFLENGQLTVFLGEEDSWVKGTPINDALEAHKVALQKVMDQLEAIDAQLKDENLSDAQREQLNQQESALESQYYQLFENTIAQNITNPLGVDLLKNYYYQMDGEQLAATVAQIPAELAEGDETIDRIKQVAVKLSATAPGKPFADFAMKTPEGKDIKLSDYAGKGKVVLVDFWASWCGPCRVEMPNVKEAYAKYKDKGFEIVGVSLDRTEEAWKQGIEELGITWPQMSDVMYWQCEGAQLYGVQAIPATVLIDKDGTILKRNLRGSELAAELEKILG